MSAAALQPSDQLWAEMRRAGQLFFSACDTRVAIAEMTKRGAL